MAQMKEQIKAPEKIQRRNEEIANLLDAQFKTGDRDAHRNDWIWSPNRAKSEGYAKWNKSIQGTNSDRKETGTQINGLDQKEKRNIQLEQNEAARIQKNEEKANPTDAEFKTLVIRMLTEMVEYRYKTEAEVKAMQVK